jgi:hypothetical protein
MAEIVQNIDGRINKVAADNEETIIEWLKKLRRTDRRKSIFTGIAQGQRITIPKPGLSKEVEVLGFPLKDAGFYVVELESRLPYGGTPLLHGQGRTHQIFPPFFDTGK